MQNWHSLKVEEVLKILGSSRDGLSPQQAARRLKKYGKNVIDNGSNIHPMRILVSQLINPLILILVFAGIFAFLAGELVDSAIIALIVLINTAIGFYQEYKAERAIESLKKINALHAKIIRGGVQTQIDSHLLVPGDIVLLESGTKVPADIRLIETASLQIDEAILTGESVPESKNLDLVEADTALGDRRNMIYSGTIVTKGRGMGVVVETAISTEVGKIAELVQTEKKSQTPLQKRLNSLAKMLGIVAVVATVPIVVLGFLRGEDLFHILELGVSLAVSAVPEGLQVIITITLAMGVSKMLKANALVRRLPVVEVLGSSDVICTDKTGTLTTNQMMVREVYTPNSHYVFSGNGFSEKGFISEKKLKTKWVVDYDVEIPKSDNILTKTPLKKVLVASILCNDATNKIGDPTEIALVVAGSKYDIEFSKLRERYARTDEEPFSSDTKYMVTRNEDYGDALKGATEPVLNLCKLPATEKRLIRQASEAMAAKGLRVLAIATKIGRGNLISKDYEFLGLVGMIDPPRPDVKDAIAVCKKAGIRVIMITGDHALTAKAIAKEVGIESDTSLTGEDISKASDQEFTELVKTTNIFARVTSEDKLKILKELQNQGHIVGMGGDGVNDAPAIKKADIGFSVENGTDLTKEVADMILLDSSFATIPKAIKQGRTIFQNIKNFLKLLLSSNFDELLLIFTSIIIGAPLFFSPIHILWINLLTDGLPAINLAQDEPEENIMNQPPRKKTYNMLKEIMPFIFCVAIVTFLGVLILFPTIYPWWQFSEPQPELIIKAQTVAFVTAVLFELIEVYQVRTNSFSFKLSKFNNSGLNYSVILSFILLISAVYIPWFNVIFKTVPLGFAEWWKILATVIIGSSVIEVFKNNWYGGKVG